MRVFIALDLPEEIKKEIEKIQGDLPDFKGKKTELENLHLTLKFLGEIDKETLDNVKKRLREINFKKFKAKLSNLGVFDENFVKIIWIKLENCDGLQKEIDYKLEDLFEKEKRFMSHITIARVKNIENKEKFLEELKKIKITEKEFLVKNFKLKESILKRERAEYKDLEVYFLK
ncbi:MAG: RNA 2',3'-cyclic phosphodiesterase [Candidatus Pacearchaeota archaeon]